MGCPIHGGEWKTIPAGVSKTTGKSYNAFQVCPEKGCPNKPPRDPQTPRPAPAQSVEVMACLGRIEARISTLEALFRKQYEKKEEAGPGELPSW